MVTRVASFGRSQALIAQLMVAQQRAQQSLVQSSTGRKADEFDRVTGAHFNAKGLIRKLIILQD